MNTGKSANIEILERRSIFSNTVSLGLLQFFSYGVPIISIPLITSMIGYEDFSNFVVVFSVIQFAKVFSDYGFNIYGVETLARTKLNSEALNFVQRVYSAKILIITPITLVCLLMWTYLDSSTSLFDTVLIASTVAINSIYPNWITTGLERSEIHLAAQALSKSIYITILFYVESITFSGLLGCLFVTSAIASSYCLWKIRHLFQDFKPRLNGVLEPLKQARQYFFSTTLSASYNLLPTSILGMSGSIDTGFYSIADHVYKAAQSAAIPISTSLLPFLSRTKKASYFKYFLLIFLVSGSALILMISPYIEGILERFIGSEYLPAMEFISIFLVIIPVNFLNVMCGYPLYSLVGKTVIAARTALVGAICFWGTIYLFMMLDKLTATNLCLLILLVESLVLMMRLALFKAAKKYV